MNFPLYSHNKNELVSLEGTKSLFYEYLPPDLEQKSGDDLKVTLESLESDLRTHDFGKFLKLYYLNERFYINSELSPLLGEAKINPSEKPLETFLGGELESNIEFYEDYFLKNTQYSRLISVLTPPAQLKELEVSLSLPKGVDLVIQLERYETSKAKASLDFKRRINFTSLFKDLKDIDGEKAYEQSESLLEAVTSSELSLFHCECFFVLHASTKERLDTLTSEMLSSLKTLDAKAMIETRGLAYFYCSLVPGVNPKFKRSFDVTSEYLSYLIPFHQDQLLDEGIEFESRSGVPVKFNLFEPSAHNYNLLITGSSGQGKSMVANKLIYNELEKGTRVVCLDLGNSFKKNALCHKASMFSQSFNPFQFKSARYLKEFILACMDEKLSKSESGRLFEAIEKALEEDCQSFDELIIRLEVDFKGLRHYFSEIREFFVNETAEAQDFTYCDFSDYPEAIKAPLVLFLIEYFKNLEGRKVFVFDECWSLLENNSDYIAECFRTFRKHNASAVAISQNLDDFSETQLGRVIVQNTYFKFFFRQHLSPSEFVTNHLMQSVGNVRTVKGQYSEFIAFSESFLKPIRYFSTPLEYEIFTSDKTDQTLINEYMEECGRFLDYPKAIENFTEIKYPNWRKYA